MEKLLKEVHENGKKWLLTVLTGVIVFYVLFIFKGYNIQTNLSYSGHSLLFRSFSFAMLTTIIFYIFQFKVAKYVPLFKGKTILIHCVATITGLHATFILFNFFWKWTEWNFKAYSHFIYEYPLIIITPIFMVWLVFKYASLQGNIESNTYVFSSHNGKEVIEILKTDFLFMKASGNYTEIFYKSNEVMKSHLLRKNLKRFEFDFKEDGALKKCHRSYIFNTEINKIVIKQKGKVFLDFGYEKIPVSKTYVTNF